MPVWGYWVLGGFIALLVFAFIAMTRTRKPQIAMPEKQAPALAKAPLARKEIPLPVTLPKPVPKPLSNAEFVLKDYPTDKSASSGAARAQRAIALLAMKDPLWVTDFQNVSDLSNDVESCIISPLFLRIFGKPDSERVYEVNGKVVSFLQTRRDYRLNEYTYFNRALNPTTQKRESLTIQFVDSVFSAAIASSGNKLER